MEIFSWLITMGLVVLALKIYFFLPDLEINEKHQLYDAYNNLKEVLNLISLACICLALFAFIIARFIRRTRRKKAQVYELTQLIKNL